jgi:hypothetical protein
MAERRFSVAGGEKLFLPEQGLQPACAHSCQHAGLIETIEFRK